MEDKIESKDENKKSTFNTFSEGLSKLKLKRNTKKELNLKSQEGNQPIQTNLSELEKLLIQLKNTNTNLKEELGANISVNNNFNININSNINIKSSNDNSPNKIQENNSFKSNHELNNKNPFKVEEIEIEEIPEIENNLKMNEKNMYNEISEIKKDSLLNKQEDNDEDNDIKKFITGSVNTNNKNTIVNDNWDDSIEKRESLNKDTIISNVVNTHLKRDESSYKILDDAKTEDKITDDILMSDIKPHYPNMNNESSEIRILNKPYNENIKENKNNFMNDFTNNFNETQQSLKVENNNLNTNVNLDFFETEMESNRKEDKKQQKLESHRNENDLNDEVNPQNVNLDFFETEMEPNRNENIKKDDFNLINNKINDNDYKNNLQNLANQKSVNMDFFETEMEDNNKNNINHNNNNLLTNQANKVSNNPQNVELDFFETEMEDNNKNNINHNNNYLNNQANKVSNNPQNVELDFFETEMEDNNKNNINNNNLLTNQLPFEQAKILSFNPQNPDLDFFETEVEQPQIINIKNQATTPNFTGNYNPLIEQEINKNKNNTPLNFEIESDTNSFNLKLNNNLYLEPAKIINQTVNQEDLLQSVHTESIMSNNQKENEEQYNRETILGVVKMNIDESLLKKDNIELDTSDIPEVGEVEDKSNNKNKNENNEDFNKLTSVFTFDQNQSTIKQSIYTNDYNDKFSPDIEILNSVTGSEVISPNQEERTNPITTNYQNENKIILNDIKQMYTEKESFNFDARELEVISEHDSQLKESELSQTNSPALDEDKNDIKNETIYIENENRNNETIYEDEIVSQNKDDIIKESTNKDINSHNTGSFNITNKPTENVGESNKIFNIINTEQEEHVYIVDDLSAANLEENDFVFEDAAEETPIIMDLSNNQKTSNKNVLQNLNIENYQEINKDNHIININSNRDTINAFFGDSLSPAQKVKSKPPQNNINISHDTENHHFEEEEKERLKSEERRENKSKINNNKNIEIDPMNYNSNNVLLTNEDDNKSLHRRDYKRLIQFEKTEIFYNQTMNDFSKIFREKNYLFLKRRKYFIQNEYYRNYFLKENNIVDRFKKLPHNYTDILEDGLITFLKDSNFHSIFQDVIGHDNNNKAEILKLLETTRDEEYLSLIGKIKPIRTFKDKYNISQANDKEICEETTKEISAWREVLCDGDSFYRAFMFGLFEYYILSQNLHEIQKLVLDIYRINKNPGATLFKTRKMDFNIALVIFHLIVEHLQNKNVEKAYDVFIKAYSMEDNSFDLILIGYMRLILYLNIAELEKQVHKFHKQKEVENVETKKKATQPDYEEVNTDTFLVYQNEPTKLALSLIPLVFNVSLDLYVYDGSISKVKNSIGFTRQKYVLNAINELPVISICYHFSSYSKFYSKSFLEKFTNIFKSNMEPNLTRNAFIGKEEDCQKCNKKTKSLLLVKYGTSVCLDCVLEYVMDTMEKRAVMFNKENFINREYYSRTIELKDDIFLDELDIFLLFGTNISSLLLQNMKKICFNCDTVLKSHEDLLYLECTCQLCRECLNKFIYAATNGEMVLNKFEKKNIKQIGCCCNLPFNTENAFKVISQTSREYREKAIQRLENYASSICMKCNNLLVEESEAFQVQNSKYDYFRLKIQFDLTQRDSEKEVAKVDHLICNKCVDRILKQDSVDQSRHKKMGANINIPPNVKYIQCKICDEEHCIEMKEWNNIFKRNCCGQCNIY